MSCRLIHIVEENKKALLLQKPKSLKNHIKQCARYNEQNIKPTKYAHSHYFTATEPYDEINIDLIGEYEHTKAGL